MGGRLIKTHRRIKSLIVVMEWVSDTALLKTVVSATQTQKLGEWALNTEQQERLKKSFDTFDVEGKGPLTQDPVKEAPPLRGHGGG
jgi:hypothetical protein